MNKVCILTSEESFINNYGAALQGYALNQTIEKMGYEPAIVKYRGGMPTPPPKFTGIRRVRALLGRIKRRIFVKKSVRQKKACERKYKKEILLREEYFREFARSNFRYINSERISWLALKDAPPVADIYLCGSDQIWNPFFKAGRNDLGYFLDFAPADKPRIAYAPSFGCAELPPPAKENIAELIAKFHAVSVREAAGQSIIKKETGRDVPVVADPTLLFTTQDWEAVEKKVDGLPEKYILCYRFSDNPETKRSIDAISKTLGLPVVTLPLSVPALRDKGYQKVFCAGPAEFVWLIHHAEFVCTDSFHATVFSLLFHRPFAVFLRENFHNQSSNMNSRIDNLLSIAELKDRVVAGPIDEDALVSLTDVSFDAFDENIKSLREFSLNWLENALKKE